MFEERADFIISLTVLANYVTLSSVNTDLFKSLTPLAADTELFWKILTSEAVRLSKIELLDAILKNLGKKENHSRSGVLFKVERRWVKRNKKVLKVVKCFKVFLIKVSWL